MLAELAQKLVDLLFAAKEQAGIFLAESEQAAIRAESLAKGAGVSEGTTANAA